MTQPTVMPPPVPARKPKGKGMWITGLVMLLVGIVMMVGGAIAGVGSAAKVLGNVGSPQSTPGSFTQHLDKGAYLVYELVLDPSSGSALSPSDITVTDPGGSSVGVTDSSVGTQTVTVNEDTYRARFGFEASSSGDYQFQVGGSDAVIAVGPSITALGSTFAWFGLIGIGGLIAFIGFILLIIGIVRQVSSKKASPPGYATPGYTPPAATAAPAGAAAALPPPVAPAAPAAPVPAPPATPIPVAPAATPAGWYPDTERPGGQRYWDGANWTEHRA